MARRTRTHRENPARAVFIRREIDYQLYKELLPDVVRLRVSNTKPITVYLDSPGGDTFFANLLTSLIRCPTQEGGACKMITVASGYVASCAADMLALGDYAIAYPFSQIHYHGTRQQGGEITLETIPTMAASLRATNEQFAFRLAARMFRRMVFHITQLSKEDSGKKDLIGPIELFDAKQITTFVAHLKKKLEGQQELLDQTQAKQEKFAALVASLRSTESKSGIIDVSNQAGLFRHLLDLEVATNPGLDLIELLPMVEDDYLQLRDFFFGAYQRNLQAIVATSGATFLTPDEELEMLAEEHNGKKARFEYLLRTVSPRLEPLWFFVVSLCRALQEGEYPMSPEDAYWAGLVDEVVGKRLPCLRIETEPGRPQPSSSETTPPPRAVGP